MKCERPSKRQLAGTESQHFTITYMLGVLPRQIGGLEEGICGWGGGTAALRTGTYNLTECTVNVSHRRRGCCLKHNTHCHRLQELLGYMFRQSETTEYCLWEWLSWDAVPPLVVPSLSKLRLCLHFLSCLSVGNRFGGSPLRPS